MKFCRRTLSGFQRRFKVQKTHHMTVYSWGYWMIVIRDEGEEKHDWHDINRPKK